MQGIANGNYSDRAIPTWDCAEDGHHWVGSNGGPVPYCCSQCPSIGAPCPECRESGKVRFGVRPAVCTRCRGSGRIELVETTQENVDYLVLTGERLKFVLEFWARRLRWKPAIVVRELDRMRLEGIGSQPLVGALVNAMLPETPIGPRAKKPSTADRRPRAKGAAGNIPARGETKSSIADFGENP